MRSHLKLLPGLLLLVQLLAAFSAAEAHSVLRADDELEQAVATFRQAAAGWTSEREAALARLVGLSEVQVLPVLAAEHTRSSNALREAWDGALVLRHRLEHRRGIVTGLELRLARDPSLESVLTREREGLAELERDLGKQEQIAQREEPWRASLQSAALELFAAFSDAERKAGEKLLWADADSAQELASRLGAIELLGCCGGKGTGLGLHRLLGEQLGRQAEIERKLPKAMIDVRKLERRMQEESERLGGNQIPQSTRQEYERARVEANQMRRELTRLGRGLDATVEAAARCLSRESDEDQKRSVQALERALAKEQGKARLRTLAILGALPADSIVASLRAKLEQEKEPAASAQLLHDLAALNDLSLCEAVCARWLDHETWIVRAAAVQALVRLRDKRAVPAMIARLEHAQGRFLSDLREGLVELTGQDYRSNHSLWSRWWAEAEATFEVPPAAPPTQASAEAQEQLAVTFFGISSESQRVLFVLDVSGSMNFSVVARANPTDDPGSPYDMPQAGEISRLEAARRDLLQAIGGLHDGAICNLVTYASDVWSWQDAPIALDPEKRGKLQSYVSSLSAAGGTNIHGALELAFELAGVSGNGKWEEPAFDTIFFLSDGRASIGVTTSADEILAFVREMNAAAGIVIHSIGLSGAQDAYLMRSLAEQNGGTYVSH